MAVTHTLTRLSQLWLQKAKTLTAPALGVIPDAGLGPNRVTDVTTVATWTAGAGVPAHVAADGSQYTRTDAANGDDFLYGRIAGAWVPILGNTA